MHIKEYIIKEEAYLSDAIEVSEQNKMDRKCMVVKMNVDDGTFTLAKALAVYNVPIHTYMEYVAKIALSEVNSELEGDEKLTGNQIYLQTHKAVADHLDAIVDNDELPKYISRERISHKRAAMHYNNSLEWKFPAHSLAKHDHNLGFNISKYNLKRLFVNKLKDMLWTEGCMKKGFLELSEKVHSETLSDIFEYNVSLRDSHLSSLHKIFEILERKAEGKKSETIHNFFGEANSYFSNKSKINPIEEAGVLFVAQKIFDYSVSNYDSLSTIAEQIGEPDAADILKKTMENDMAIGITLKKISENLIDNGSRSYAH